MAELDRGGPDGKKKRPWFPQFGEDHDGCSKTGLTHFIDVMGDETRCSQKRICCCIQALCPPQNGAQKRKGVSPSSPVLLTRICGCGRIQPCTCRGCKLKTGWKPLQVGLLSFLFLFHRSHMKIWEPRLEKDDLPRTRFPVNPHHCYRACLW